MHPLDFRQDNAPCHTSKKYTELLKREINQVKQWPDQSLDLNSIENIMKKLENKVQYGKTSSMANLWHIIEENWQKIVPDLYEKLVVSCGRRSAEVII